MKKAIFIFILSIRLFGPLQAQQGISVRGIVKDSSGAGLLNATIKIFGVTDTFSVLSKEGGRFQFRIPPDETFKLLVTMSGYEAVKKNFPASKDEKPLVLPPILLRPAYGELTPVTVLHIKPVIIREDTVEYNARAFNVRAGSELENLLKKLPGLIVSMDGTVTVGGKKIGRILVNGRDFAGDLLTALQNLPVDIIDKVQVIDDYGDKARLTGVKSGESEKVLNVILKEDKRNGQIGKLVAGAGDKGKYNATLFSDAMKADRQLTLNALTKNTSSAGTIHEKGLYTGYSDLWDKKWSNNSSLGLSGDHHSSENGIIQDNFFPRSKIHLEQNIQNSGNKAIFAVGTTFICTPSLGTTLRISPSFNDFRSEERTANHFSSVEQDSGFTKATTGVSNNVTHTHSQSAGSDIYFERSYPGSGNRLSFNGSFHYTHTKGANDQSTNTQIKTDSLDNNSRQHYLLNNDDTKKDLNASLNYYTSLGKSSFLELGYTLNYSYTQNGKVTQSLDSLDLHPMTIDSLSNDYYFRVMNNRFHIGYSAQLKKLNLTLGLDAQPSVQSGQTVGKGTITEYHYSPLLPMAQLAYSLSSTRRLNFEYSGNSSPPSLQQLQPVTDLSNPQYPVTGNPHLKASYTHIVWLHYEQSSVHPMRLPSLGWTIRYATVQNMVIGNLEHPADTSSVIQRTNFINANGFHTLTADYHVDFPRLLSKRLRLSWGGAISNLQTANEVDNTLYNTNSINWNQSLTFSLDIPDIIESELNGNYTHSFSRYSGSNSSFSSASWTLHDRHFFNKWVVEYSLTQLFSPDGQGIKGNPALLNATLQKEFFSNNRLSLNFSVNNILNVNSGTSQVITPTSVTQNNSSLVGRYFLLTVQWKLQHFR